MRDERGLSAETPKALIAGCWVTEGLAKARGKRGLIPVLDDICLVVTRGFLWWFACEDASSSAVGRFGASTSHWAERFLAPQACDATQVPWCSADAARGWVKGSGWGCGTAS